MFFRVLLVIFPVQIIQEQSVHLAFLFVQYQIFFGDNVWVWFELRRVFLFVLTKAFPCTEPVMLRIVPELIGPVATAAGEELLSADGAGLELVGLDLDFV